VTPEAKVKEKIKRWLDLHMPGHWRVMPRGGPFGKAGCPDILICWKGIFIAIEVKASDGVLSHLQLMSLQKIQAAGGVAAVVRGFDESRLIAVRNAALYRVSQNVLLDN
jgi:hypothetical protein